MGWRLLKKFHGRFHFSSVFSVIGVMRWRKSCLYFFIHNYLMETDLFRYIRSLLLIYSANTSFALSMPAIAAVLAYITYSASGHQLLPASLFSSLTLFNLLRVPLMHLRKSIDPLIPTWMYVILFSSSTKLQFHYGCGQCSRAARLSEVFVLHK